MKRKMLRVLNVGVPELGVGGAREGVVGSPIMGEKMKASLELLPRHWGHT